MIMIMVNMIFQTRCRSKVLKFSNLLVTIFYYRHLLILLILLNLILNYYYCYLIVEVDFKLFTKYPINYQSIES